MKPTADDFSRQGDKYIGTPYSQMDCQALIERMLKDAGISMDLPGSNAWFRKMTWTGSPEECKRVFGQIPVGAFLFILENDGGEVARGYTDGLGNASHIGVYIARNDGAIHSSSSRGCVAYSKFSGKTIPNGGWNQVGLWDKLSYGEPIDTILSGKEVEPMEAVVKASNGQPVKMRKEPSKDATIITKLSVGTHVDVISYGADWCQIRWSDIEGWMMTEFLSFDSGDQGGTDVDPETVHISLDLPIEVARQIIEQITEQIGRG